jgi:hypothetical protein
MTEVQEKPQLLFSRFRVSKRKLLLGFLGILILSALIEFLVLGLARRTFLFYTLDNGSASVEERMHRVSSRNLKAFGKSPVSSSRELDLTGYVEEALLGPVSPNSLPLFPKGTRLVSLLYRNGVVDVGLSEEAALPPLESATLPGMEVFTSLETLYFGIKRNFPFVREVRFFIAGNAAFAGKFRQ